MTAPTSPEIPDADVSLALQIQFAFAGLSLGARLALLRNLRKVHAALEEAATPHRNGGGR